MLFKRCNLKLGHQNDNKEIIPRPMTHSDCILFKPLCWKGISGGILYIYFVRPDGSIGELVQFWILAPWDYFPENYQDESQGLAVEPCHFSYIKIYFLWIIWPHLCVFQACKCWDRDYFKTNMSQSLQKTKFHIYVYVLKESNVLGTPLREIIFMELYIQILQKCY